MATTEKKGLMSANDKKYSIQFITFRTNTGRKLIEINGSYERFICVGFLLSGSSPTNFILSGRSEDTNKNISMNYKLINGGNRLKVYKKENCFYIFNDNKSDSCFGFLISTQTIGTDDVTIDDSFTLLE